jgi:hypothetical protein
VRVLKFQKNSEDWREFRDGKSGGSEFSKLYPKANPKKEIVEGALKKAGLIYDSKQSVDTLLGLLTPEQKGEVKASQDWKDEVYKLIAQRVARPITPNDYADELNGQPFSMMARGHILEPQAVAMFEGVTGLKADEDCVVWVRDDNENSYVSPDAAVTKRGVVEISAEMKCPDSHVIIRAWHENKYPEDYHHQAIKHFIVNKGLKKHYICLFTDVMPALPFVMFCIERKDVENEIRELEAFENAILQQVAELTEKLAF